MTFSLIATVAALVLFPGVPTEQSQLVEERRIEKGSASQGLALGEDCFFGSNSQSICRFDKNWKLLEEKSVRIDGVNHIGAIDYHQGIIWAGLLHGPENGEHDPKLDRAIIARIRASDLTVVQTWDISADVTWIDPVCFDGKYLWVGDLSDLGIHRYRFQRGDLVRDGVLRYPKDMHFSQGIRVLDDKLYSIHTFGNMDGLFEFAIPDKLGDVSIKPRRNWEIKETRTHLEGFDFLPDKPDELWHAQGSQVDRYRLSGFEVTAEKDETMRYSVARLSANKGDEKAFSIDADWEKPAWKEVEPLELTYHMGSLPEHFPRVQAKLLYDDEAVYVIFRVEDRYVRAVAAQNQGSVYNDSCAEFFFIPETDHTTGYFNLEMNCGGTMLFHYQDLPREDPIELSNEELAQIEVAHTQPKIVDPEITTPTLWHIEYRLPLALIKKYYHAAVHPAPGVVWRANFYKCADATSHPHWLTWARVDNPHPDFHIPKYFGQLEFE